MIFDRSTWRAILDAPASGAWNMAVDEAILEATIQGKAPPTLRLYAWKPPCLSLGYAQSIVDVDRERLHTLNWELVRRPTGGRAILHTDELTYAVIGPLGEPRLAGSVLESYQRLAQALLKALHLLMIPAQAEEKPSAPSGGEANGPICFEVPSNYEITVDGRKILGSAQARKQGGLLQHGSLPLYGDVGRIAQALAFMDESQRAAAAARVRQRATTVEEALGKALSWEEVANAFLEAFAETLNIDLRIDELSPEENRRAKELQAEKYGNPEWNART